MLFFLYPRNEFIIIFLLKNIQKEIQFVQATRDYLTLTNENEDHFHVINNNINKTQAPATSSLLSFRQNDIIKLVNKSYTPHGWLRGCLNGKKGLFPIEYVKPVHRAELTDINKVNGCLKKKSFHAHFRFRTD
jgi:hypothetical protein